MNRRYRDDEDEPASGGVRWGWVLAGVGGFLVGGACLVMIGFMITTSMRLERADRDLRDLRSRVFELELKSK